jgi:hypothetical protein
MSWREDEQDRLRKAARQRDDERNPGWNPFEKEHVSATQASVIPSRRPRAYEHNECPQCKEKCVGHYTGSSMKWHWFAGQCRFCGTGFLFSTSGSVHAAVIQEFHGPPKRGVIPG